MIVPVLLAIAAIFLALGWFFWLRERLNFSLKTWRAVFVWLGLTMLTLAVLTFLLFLVMVHRAEIADQPFTAVLPVIRIGSLFSDIALLTNWFNKGKSRISLVISSVLMWVLWIAQAMGV